MVAWQFSRELGVCDGGARMAVVLWVFRRAVLNATLFANLILSMSQCPLVRALMMACHTSQTLAMTPRAAGGHGENGLLNCGSPGRRDSPICASRASARGTTSFGVILIRPPLLV